MQEYCYELLEHAQKIFRQLKDMRKTEIQGENVFGKRSHDPLTKAREMLKTSVVKLLLCGSVGPEEKKKKGKKKKERKKI